MTTEASDYTVGDVVSWRLVNGQSHTGIVVPGPGARKSGKWIVHNIGRGPVWEDPALAENANEDQARPIRNASLLMNVHWIGRGLVGPLSCQRVSLVQARGMAMRGNPQLMMN